MDGVIVEQIINYIKSIILVLTIPIAYVQIKKSSLDKALKIIDEVAQIIIYRLYTNNRISAEDIKGVIRTKSIQNKVNSKTIPLDLCLEKAVEKIEESPFLSRIKRRKLLEAIIPLKEFKSSYRMDLLIGINTYKKQLIIVSAIIIVGFSLYISNQWTIFQSLNLAQKTLAQIGIGMLLIPIISFLAYLIYFEFKGRSFAGFARIKYSSYEYLPNFYDERLYLIDVKRNKKIKLSFEKSSIERNERTVDTYPGCLNLGILRVYKKHQKYSVSFHDVNREYEMELYIRSESYVNGSIEVDIIGYKIKLPNIDEIEFKYPVGSDDKSRTFVDERLNYKSRVFKDVGEKERFMEGHYFSVKQNEDCVCLNKEKKVIGFIINNELYSI